MLFELALRLGCTVGALLYGPVPLSNKEFVQWGAFFSAKAKLQESA